MKISTLSSSLLAALVMILACGALALAADDTTPAATPAAETAAKKDAAPAAKTEAETAAAKPPVAKSAAGASAGAVKPKVYVIPIDGPIEHFCLVAGVERALKEAKEKKCSYVVFRLNTPGGLCAVGDKITAMIEAMDWAEPVAWVNGDENRAVSCGAYIAWATVRIFMSPGSTMGAATPYMASSGSARVDNKMLSIWRARFRSLAQKRGRSELLGDAMVDCNVSVVQVWVDGKMEMVSEEQATSLAAEHKGDKKFKRGKTVNKKGDLIILTADELMEFGVINGIAGNKEDFLKALSLPADTTIIEATWLNEQVKKRAEEDKKKFDKLILAFQSNLQQAQINDPANFYPLTEMGSNRWRTQTSKCMRYLEECGKALKQIEVMSNDETSNNRADPERISQMKINMESFYKRLQSGMTK